MSEEEIIQEIEKLELEEEKEKTVKYLLKVVIEGKKDIIQEKEFFLKQQQKEIEELKERIKQALEEIDTGEYTAYTLYGDILFRDNDLVKILKGEE